MAKKPKQTKQPTDADLLLELSTMDSVEARIVTDADQRNGLAPAWCELTLAMERGGHTKIEHLRRADGELIIEVLNDVLHPNRVSTLHLLWGELDAIIDRLMAEPTKKDRASAQAMGKAIALCINPYHPNEDAVREEAVRRYHERTA